jgi:tetratricopeptide (TPR) repeat protein
LRRFDEARAAIQAGLREAESHADGRAQRVALRRILGLIESVSGRHAEALAAFEEALVIAPGVVTPFEELRLHLMAAGQLADLGRKEAAMARVQATVARVDPERHDASRWMLFADAAEVMARAQACSEAVSLYRRVDDLIPGGRMPRDWLGNRLSYTAGCTADPARAAELARQALEAYGAMLSADSPRRRKLEALMAGR